MALLKLTELNNDQINYANIGLMLLSCLIAFVVPFELFLFSYAVLGPLHYLTEIGWLHKKNYFTKGKYDFIALGFLCVLVFYFSFVRPTTTGTQVTHVITFALLIAAVFVFVKDNLYRAALCVLALVGLATAKFGNYYFMWVGVFLPTIIHVFVFTWAFMLFGVLKNRSLSGYLSVVALLLIAFSFFVIKAPQLQYQVSAYVGKSYDLFSLLNKYLIAFFNLSPTVTDDTVFNTNAGFVIMRFIAFAYTYHYLNWFSKTSVIKWHLVPRKTLLITIGLWIFSVALYLVDYSTGLKALYFLSFLHVFLEFPLNITSFQGIFKAVFSFRK